MFMFYMMLVIACFLPVIYSFIPRKKNTQLLLLFSSIVLIVLITVDGIATLLLPDNISLFIFMSIMLAVDILLMFFKNRKEEVSQSVIERIEILENKLGNVNIQKSKIKEPVIEEVKKIEWKDLTEEEKSKYITFAIKLLYKEQLADETLELSRQQKAIKKDCLETNEFFVEDLTEEELEQVNKIAEQNYENGVEEVQEKSSKKQSKKLKKNKDEKTEECDSKEKDGRLLKTNPIWILKSLLISVTKTPVGKLLSISGEPPVSGEVRYQNFGMYFVCYNFLQGFNIKRDDVKKLKITPVNALMSKATFTLKNEKIILMELNPTGVEKAMKCYGAAITED